LINIGNYCRNFIKKSRSFLAGLSGSRRIDVFLFAAALVVLAAAVSGRFFAGGEKTRRIDISISQRGTELFGAGALGALIQEFEEQYPDLRIQTVEGDGADIVFFDDSEFAALMADSALASLRPYIHNETQAGQWAVPLVSFMDLFFYNIDILEAANCDRPPKTRADFVAAARAIAALETAYPLALGLSEEDPLALRSSLYPWVWASGGDLRQAAEAAGRNAPPADAALSRAASGIIVFFGDLHSDGLLAPGSFEKTGAQRLEEFASGAVAMLAASSRDIPFLRRAAAGLNFGVTAVPQTAQGKNRLALSGIYAGISAGCAQSDEAWTFLAYIAGRKQALEEALDAIPGSFPSAFPAAYAEQDPLLSKAWEIFEAADIVDYFPADPLELETARIIREQLAGVF